MRKLDGKIALITGGSSGIGLATAKEFVREGAYVFITGPLDPELATAVKEIGRSVTGVQGDVSNLRDLDRLFAQIRRDKGRLDIVFVNADGAKFAPLGPPLGQITEEHFDSLFDINVKGLLFTVQKALALMPDGASIILNASILAGKGWPTSSVYSATKAVARSFARTWTAVLKDRRIRVNAISSGFIGTPTWPVSEARRTATSEEIAEVVAFLASEDSSYITGAELFVDGGIAQEAIAKAVVFLASEDSSYITGSELFVDGGIAQV